MNVPPPECRDFSARAHRGPEPERFGWRLLSPRSLLHWIGLGLLSVLWLLLPRRWRDRLGMALGRIMARGRWPRRIPANLRRCFPQLSDAELTAWVLHYCQIQACVFLDLPALWLSSAQRQLQRTRFEGIEHLEQHFQAGRPVCLLVCHSLGMEHAARALKWCYPLLGYYRPFGAPVVDRLFYRFRSRNGGYLLQRGDSLRPLVKDLREGWMLYMMIDEDMGPKEGHWAPFFATQKCAINAPSKLARASGAASVPLYSWYDPREGVYRVQLLPALERFPSGNAQTDVATLMATLERMIDCQPKQFGWRQQLFRTPV